MASKPIHFNDVPLDIKKNIILGYITRPEDLKSLCLTSKELRDIATPPLYRKVLLFIGGHNDIRVSGLLSRTNPGIQYIRKVYLQLEKTPIPPLDFQVNSDDSSEDEGEVHMEEIVGAARQAQFTVRLLLDFLPNDILENFSWQNWEPFSMDNWMLLMKKQKRLKAVEIESVDRNFMPELDKNPSLLTNQERTTSLHFYPDTIDRLKACQRVVETQTKFNELQLSSGFVYTSAIPPDDLEDSSTRPGLLTRTVFSHMMPFETCTPMILKKLSIDNIDLRYAADTYMKFIKFSALESFVIGGCRGADTVFAQMSKPHLRPTNLKKIRWFHGEEGSETHALEAFDGLLEAITGLEVLHVDIKNFGRLPNPTAIAHHGKTLRTLGIRSRTVSSNPMRYESEQLDEICTACTELRQLSITFPTTSVSDAHPSSEFKQALRCLKKLRYRTYCGASLTISYQNMSRKTQFKSKIRELITINFHSWPTTRSSFISRNYKLKQEWYDLYEHALQRLAQQIFEASDAHSREHGWGLGHRSLLAVIAFGANGKTSPDGESNFKLKQLPFVRGSKVDPFGKTEMLAVKTLWRMVQFIEPESDILNHSIYDLHDAHNSP